MAARPKVTTVSEYLKLLTPPQRRLLGRVIALISHMDINPPVRAAAR